MAAPSRPSSTGPSSAGASSSGPSSANSSLEATITRAWLRRGPLACALWPLSLLFRALSGLRATLYRLGIKRAGRLPVPVIVVGNIFIGGTGKTPLTIWLARALVDAGYRPGIVSRGFGSSAAAPTAVLPASSAAQVGDEPILIARRTACPVMVGRARFEAGRALLAAHPDVNVLIADDGLQHYALARDLEIMLFDGRGVGNGWLLPAGPLREPVSRRRDFTVVNAPALTADLCSAVGGAPFRMQLEGDMAERLAAPHERVPLAALRGRRLVAAAGIGNPQRFFSMLRASGLEVAELALPDHHDFRDRPFAGIEADAILITEKDAVKCALLEDLRNDPRLWVVPVTARLDAALAEQIVNKLENRHGRPTA